MRFEYDDLLLDGAARFGTADVEARGVSGSVVSLVSFTFGFGGMWTD